MSNEIPKVFKAEDFKDMYGYILTKEGCAYQANKILSERLTKYHAELEPSGCYLVGVVPAQNDTHVIYGLEPQEIKREPIKIEFNAEVDHLGCVHVSDNLTGKRVKVTVEEIL